RPSGAPYRLSCRFSARRLPARQLARGARNPPEQPVRLLAPVALRQREARLGSRLSRGSVTRSARPLLRLRLGRSPQPDLVQQGLDRAAGEAERGLVNEPAVLDLAIGAGDQDLAR